MKQEELLKEKYGTDPGFKVPEGYFEDLKRNVMMSLPLYPEVQRKVELSRWQRIKPYIYLAAMFAGIWLMMKVFHNVTSTGNLSLENPPAALVQLWEEEGFDIYPLYSSEPEFLLEEEVGMEYDNFDEFEKDFGYDFKPEYESSPVSLPVTEAVSNV